MEANQIDNATLNELAFHNANIGEPMSDWMLRYLVDMANLQELQIGLTLLVDGMLVSGTLIGGQAYFAGITQTISSAMCDSPEATAVTDLFEKVNRAVHAETSPEKPSPPPAYIHMKDTYFFQPGNTGSTPSSQGVLWRGKLSQVSGFFFGNLTA